LPFNSKYRNIETIIVLSAATGLIHYIDPDTKACALKYKIIIFEFINHCKADQ